MCTWLLAPRKTLLPPSSPPEVPPPHPNIFPTDPPRVFQASFRESLPVIIIASVPPTITRDQTDRPLRALVKPRVCRPARIVFSLGPQIMLQHRVATNHYSITETVSLGGPGESPEFEPSWGSKCPQTLSTKIHTAEREFSENTLLKNYGSRSGWPVH